MFIGTNFDCHQPTFNYEAEAHVESWIDVFGTTKQAFYAQFIYGADEGSQLPDQAVVNVWGKQIYQKDLKAVDCSPHTVPVAHSDPGLDKKFTIWASFIPVTLHITTNLDLDLSCVPCFRSGSFLFFFLSRSLALSSARTRFSPPVWLAPAGRPTFS
jgi:hypothetical protein